MGHRRRHFRSWVIIPAVVFAASFLAPGTALALPKNVPNRIDPPPGQDPCVPDSYPVFDASVTPLRGLLGADTVVGVGTAVQLRGRAFNWRTARNCTTSFQPFANPRWSMTFIPQGGDPVTASNQLSVTTGLVTGFTAAALGSYRATFAADPPTGITLTPVAIRIDVVSSPIGWSSVGPDGTLNGAPGRVDSIVFGQGSTLYASSDSGGVWKCCDAGLWRPMSDRKGVGPIRGGDLVMSGSTLFARAREAWGVGTPDDVLVSNDAGNTWTRTPSTCPGGEEPSGSPINRLQLGRSGAVYEATDSGLLRRAPDGCWIRVYGAPPTRVTDVATDPTGTADVLLLGVPGTGIVRIDEADSGSPSVSPALGSIGDPLASSGLPVGPSMYIRVAVAPNGRIYAVFSKWRFPPPQPYQETLQLWTKLGASAPVRRPLGTFQDQSGNVDPNPIGCWGNYCDYDLTLTVDPANSDDVWLSTVNLWRSTNAGSSWVAVTNWEVNTMRMLHGDIHEVRFRGSFVYVSTDGGVYASSLAGPRMVWGTLNRGLEVGELYQVATAPRVRGAIAGGYQDNGSQERVAGRAWTGLPGAGGDGRSAGYDAADTTASCIRSCTSSLIYYHRGTANGDTVYSSRRNTSALGAMTRFWADPYRPGVLLGVADSGGVPVVDQGLYVSVGNDGRRPPSWVCIDPIAGVPHYVVAVTATRAAVSPGSLVYAVAVNSGAGGEVYIVEVGDLPNGISTTCSQIPPRTATRIYPVGPAVGSKQLNDLSEDPRLPCVFYLAGASPAREWRVSRLVAQGVDCTTVALTTPIAGVVSADGPSPLPATALTYQVQADPSIVTGDPPRAVVYVGTDRGLYVGTPTVTGEYDWKRALDFPYTKVTDLEIQRTSTGPTGFVYAATYGRGVWQRIFSSSDAPVSADGPGTSLVADGSRGRVEAGLAPAAAAYHLSVSSCEARQLGTGPGAPGQYATVDVHYTNMDPPAGISIRPEVTRHGETQPLFSREVDKLHAGPGWVQLVLAYASASAPLRLETDGIMLSFLDENGQMVGHARCDFPAIWLSGRAAAVHVDGLLGQVEGGAAKLGLEMVVSDVTGHILQHGVTPFDVAVERERDLTFSVVKGPADASFVGFLADELRVGGHEPRITLRIHQNATLSATYRETR